MGIVRKMNSFNVGWILFIVSAFTLGGNSKRYLVETKQKDTDDIPCICNKEASFPVCGVDGKTYQSQCLAKCSNVSTKCPGECPCGKKKSVLRSSYMILYVESMERPMTIDGLLTVKKYLFIVKENVLVKKR